MIWRHVANLRCLVFIWGTLAALLSVSKSISCPLLPRPPLLLQFETGVREAGDGEDGDPETLRDGERPS